MSVHVVVSADAICLPSDVSSRYRRIAWNSCSRNRCVPRISAQSPWGLCRGGYFFVISGFLISSIIAKDIANGRFGFGAFYARRIRRIFPALLLVLAVTLVGG